MKSRGLGEGRFFCENPPFHFAACFLGTDLCPQAWEEHLSCSYQIVTDGVKLKLRLGITAVTGPRDVRTSAFTGLHRAAPGGPGSQCLRRSGADVIEGDRMKSRRVESIHAEVKVMRLHSSESRAASQHVRRAKLNLKRVLQSFCRKRTKKTSRCERVNKNTHM